MVLSGPLFLRNRMVSILECYSYVNTYFPDKVHIKPFSLILILSVFVPTLFSRVNKLVKFAADKTLVRENASIVLEEKQRCYNHSVPSLSNDVFQVENPSVLVFCKCLNFDGAGGGGLLSLGQGAGRDLHLTRPFLF